MASKGPTEEGLPPLQSMLLEELNRRTDEVFDNSDEGLLHTLANKIMVVEFRSENHNNYWGLSGITTNTC